MTVRIPIGVGDGSLFIGNSQDKDVGELVIDKRVADKIIEAMRNNIPIFLCGSLGINGRIAELYGVSFSAGQAIDDAKEDET
jgi:hypothetical protein